MLLGVEDLGVTLGCCKDNEDELDEGGRGMDVDALVLTILEGREGDEVLTGVVSLGLEGVVGGVRLLSELVRFAFKAARWGRGLIGRDVFSAEDDAGAAVSGRFCSFFSSSDVLRRRRVPALRGEDGFAGSTTADFGRYLGKAEVALRLFGRRVEDLCGTTGVALAWSSEEDLAPDAETRLRETVLEGGRGSGMEVGRTEERRAVFLASLPIASAKTLPTEARLSEWRSELRGAAFSAMAISKTRLPFPDFNRHPALCLCLATTTT